MNWRAWAALVCGLVLAAPQGRAADYPTRPIKLIVPYAAGGPSDVQARMVGEYLGRDLKQNVVIENKAGAQGAIGAEAAARADPDGYTLVFLGVIGVRAQPAALQETVLRSREGFPHAGRGHGPAGRSSRSTRRCLRRRWRSWWPTPRQNPGKMNFGSAGTGGSTHLAGEMFRQMAGIDMVHIPYKGMAPALTDLISGNIQVLFDSVGTALPPINAGLVRPSRSVRRSASTNCLICRPSPRAAIPIT